MDSPSLWLGSARPGGAPVDLPQRALLRHMMALGSSGSGKTVLCKVVVEEAVRGGLPVIAVDPQGDLGSLLLAGDPNKLLEHGVDPEVARSFFDKLDLVIFTPGSTKGVPLCADPIPSGLEQLSPDERADAVSRAASTVVGLLGYDLDSDDGGGLAAALDRVLSDLVESGRASGGIEALAAELRDREQRGFADLSRFISAKKLKAAGQRLARLDVGARKKIFVEGVPLDIDVLLGLDPRAALAPGRVRVSIVYLNGLHAQEDKDFFVAALADRLYAWMLRHPSSDLQALFYIDEVAPFIPPVSKPSCKEGLVLLFKQARKYGVGCLMATQNPGDVDYKAMSQFGTWALGRVTTRQDLKKIEPTVKALDPVSSDQILSELPSLRPGQFALLSPDCFERALALSVRWLLSDHRTLDESRIAELSDPVRPRFAGLARRVAAPPAATPLLPTPAPRAGSARIQPTIVAEPLPEAMIPPAQPSRPRRGAPSHSTRADPRAVEILASRDSISARELAEATGTGEKASRAALKRLVEAGEATMFKQGSSHRFYLNRTGARPDLGLSASVLAVARFIDQGAALAIAGQHARSKILGLVGDDESVEEAQRVDRLLYRVDFEERVETSIFHRLVGAREDHRVGSVYVHPHSLAFLLFHRGRGVSFVAEPDAIASEIEDLDGFAQFIEVAPATLCIDEGEWTQRASPDQAASHFKSRFAAAPRSVTPVFFPLWQLVLRAGAGESYRIVTVDGLVGQRVEWSAPRASG